ncbi:phosphoribosylanthranilate isomerase [Ectobacillus antri]|jgi:phosphoribosylanthranilate isomerase|uniref:N-(5'-phosphoribosyl)anthranilate isomerase n=1 Tax=Ectobacillus antri TaxID=2486280 RepID=A0ABT6H8D5_9BACI|nr:phosphoribosylanthranilate isomerase [Ectobacillus antri]MDG4658316.1 phosphoribosylanthranilate isomerase [Ectobacillus antri]MDG5755595.1 phosphoribosylanthranilate isomerase [Ectobacillus antri]
MRVKVCGITDVETAKRTCEYGADALGFVFAPSKRRITPEEAADIIKELPAHVQKIGVFVNETVERVEEIAAMCGLDYVQLHGDEDACYMERLNIPFIKAFGVASREDVTRAMNSKAAYVLLDSPKGVYRGGNGTVFPWELLQELNEKERGRIILAGGLGSHNVRDAIRIVRPYMVDASSSLETEGKKDLQKIKTFIETVKEC